VRQALKLVEADRGAGCLNLADGKNAVAGLRGVSDHHHVELVVGLVLAAGDQGRLAAAGEAAERLGGCVIDAPGAGQVLEVRAVDEGRHRVGRLGPDLGPSPADQPGLEGPDDQVVEPQQRLVHLVERTAGPQRIVHLADELDPLEHVQRMTKRAVRPTQRPRDVRPLVRARADRREDRVVEACSTQFRLF
jgi:hypothetical protein